MYYGLSSSVLGALIFGQLAVMTSPLGTKWRRIGRAIRNVTFLLLLSIISFAVLLARFAGD